MFKRCKKKTIDFFSNIFRTKYVFIADRPVRDHRRLTRARSIKNGSSTLAHNVADRYETRDNRLGSITRTTTDGVHSMDRRVLPTCNRSFARLSVSNLTYKGEVEGWWWCRSNLESPKNIRFVFYSTTGGSDRIEEISIRLGRRAERK